MEDYNAMAMGCLEQLALNSDWIRVDYIYEVRLGTSRSYLSQDSTSTASLDLSLRLSCITIIMKILIFCKPEIKSGLEATILLLLAISSKIFLSVNCRWLIYFSFCQLLSGCPMITRVVLLLTKRTTLIKESVASENKSSLTGEILSKL
jgi:hypothetical protein